MAGLRRATLSLSLLALVAACGPGGRTSTAVPVQSPGPAITPSESGVVD